jgi:uncharacterized protein YjiS (DUF1127 family)
MNNSQCYEIDQPLSFAQQAPVSFWRTLLRAPASMMNTLLLWQERAAQRIHLASLNDHELRDIGLSRADVEREASLPFWRER